jgi:hypothetical protein
LGERISHLPRGAETPFLYRDGKMMDLNDLITEPGWRLTYVSAINDAGQIVGGAYPPGHAVLLTPTTP